MRFKKGSKIEVFSNKETAYGAWRPAKIISGNGHTYDVKYESSEYEGDVDRVWRKSIRPSPPPVVAGAGHWESGELVEVCHKQYWKIATIIKDIGRDYYLARLLGSTKDFPVHTVNIRVRQSWEDDRWFLIGKGTSREIAKSSKMQDPVSYSKPRVEPTSQVQVEDICSGVQDNTCYQIAYGVSSAIPYRVSPFGSSNAEACIGYRQKKRATEKRIQPNRVLSKRCSSLQKKVDAGAYPRVNLGTTCMHTFFNNRSNKNYEMDNGKSNSVHESLGAGTGESNVSQSVSSVGSCSGIIHSEGKMSSPLSADPCQDADALSSDAESVSRGEDEEKCSDSLEEDIAGTIHRLELHAYHNTLEALFVSGPLSWEQEALLTNLRISLNISDDEHLTELRKLISSQTSLRIR